MRVLELKIPPPIVAVVTALPMWQVSQVVPAFAFTFPGRNLFAISVAAVGIVTAMILTGWAILLSNALAFLLLPVFILYINRFQIAPEEKALSSLFLQDFVAYRSRVRRWI